MNYHHWRPYVSVRARRAKAAIHAAKLRKEGQSLEPVKIKGRTIARTFWGKAWCDHIESFSDFVNRLPRGRTYARNGSVFHLEIREGLVEALVSGSEIYQIQIAIEPLDPKRWTAIKRRCAGRIGSLIELLKGEISESVMAAVTDRKEGLFPKVDQVHLSCSCPDWAGLCKHAAAALYGVGARLDKAPELLFRLRGVDQQELISAEFQELQIPKKKTKGRRLANTALGDVFGLEIAPKKTRAAKPKTSKAKPKTSPSQKTKPTPKKKKPAAKNSKLTGAAMAKLRERFAMSKPQFARLLGVSAASVTKWEATSGALTLRRSSFVSWEAYRRLSKKDAWEQLELA